MREDGIALFLWIVTPTKFERVGIHQPHLIRTCQPSPSRLAALALIELEVYTHFVPLLGRRGMRDRTDVTKDPDTRLHSSSDDEAVQSTSCQGPNVSAPPIHDYAE